MRRWTAAPSPFTMKFRVAAVVVATMPVLLGSAAVSGATGVFTPEALTRKVVKADGTDESKYGTSANSAPAAVASTHTPLSENPVVMTSPTASVFFADVGRPVHGGSDAPSTMT